jgi:spore coat polysaccharide biosynthesis protein SpsF
MKCNVLAVLQARTTSSRLPNKVLKEICGKPMIIHQLERIRRSRTIDEIVVATSIDASDDHLVEILKQNDYQIFRGSLENVLERVYRAALGYLPEDVVRLTADCPLADSDVIDLIVAEHLKEKNDYTSNTITPNYPDGLDVEVIKFSSLEVASQHANLPSEFEHVTQYIKSRPNEFKMSNVGYKEDLSVLRWTVDEPEDFEFVDAVYQELYLNNFSFNMLDVLDLINKKPQLIQLNTKCLRDEGLIRSLIEDQKYLKKL